MEVGRRIQNSKFKIQNSKLRIDTKKPRLKRVLGFTFNIIKSNIQISSTTPKLAEKEPFYASFKQDFAFL